MARLQSVAELLERAMERELGQCGTTQLNYCTNHQFSDDFSMKKTKLKGNCPLPRPRMIAGGQVNHRTHEINEIGDFEIATEGRKFVQGM